MGVLGFNNEIPDRWNRVWLVMWLVVSVTLIVLAFFLTFHQWAAAAVLGFGLPEGFSLTKRNDAFPPLTHTIRHFLPSWLAFILIYGLFGSIAGTWLGFARPFHLGALFGLLGWLTEHFSATYNSPDPYPFTHPERAETISHRMTL